MRKSVVKTIFVIADTNISVMGNKKPTQKKRVIGIIGADSFIATRFYEAMDKSYLKLFSYRSTSKKEALVKDFFTITEEDLQGIDVLINFAAIVHQPEPKDDVEYVSVNEKLPQYLAKTAKDAGVEQFVQISSLAVYGDVELYDVDSPYQPQGAYGRTKLAADEVILALADDAFKVSVVRPPIVYGGGLSPGNIQRLVRMALSSVLMPFKRVQNERDFIHVYNLVEALKIICINGLSGVLIPTDKHPVSTEDVINLASIFSQNKVRKIAIPGFVRVVLKKFKPNMHHKLFGNAHVVCNMPDSYQPKYKLADGIEDLVNAIEETN